MPRQTNTPRGSGCPKRTWKKVVVLVPVLVTVPEEMKSDYCPLPSMILHLGVGRAYSRRTVQADIDGVVNAMPGNPIDVIIAVSVSGVHSRVSLPS
jgi:hypothetical protein